MSPVSPVSPVSTEALLPRPTRRAVLGCAAGAAAILSACGGDRDASTPTVEADGAVRVPLADTPVGGSTYYPGASARIVVTQPSEGRWLAYDATCTHEGCMTSATDDDGNLVCPCHGSVFDPASGEPVAGPAQEPLATLAVEVDGEDLLIRG
ncbi:Rieske (2Fe-2S) protein [Ornithinimicrobium pratense]|uniref:Cytochrome bc1 complex Rieske iron-sulfur subunit n=1 Tax=Ornithinimicrobium pratense TaxID=2593973 RepID=A0A5J6V4B6_9MICO|nr:Rieske (2Fe-2S) protein [Ornithinimicrobium pratense]QFG68749.1 Rieske (2Fe-2S) protein [Ornithinimicrobium pratense]